MEPIVNNKLAVQATGTAQIADAKGTVECMSRGRCH